MGVVLYLFVKTTHMYTETMKTKTSQVHVWKAKFSMYFFGIIFSMGSVYNNFLIPIYNL